MMHTIQLPLATSLNALVRCCATILLVAAVSGCVTETTGGLPAPAEDLERIDAQLDLARGYIEGGNIPRAKMSLNRALEIDPGHVEARVLYAVVLQSENEWELAEESYKIALQRDATNPQALNNYGRFLYGRERHGEAVEVLQLLVQNTGYRARAQAFENLGLALIAVDRQNEAHAAFTRALELSFRQPRSSLELAAIEVERSNYAAARSHLISYRTYARPSARSLCLEIQMHTALNNADEVASNTLALKNLFPQQAAQCLAKI